MVVIVIRDVVDVSDARVADVDVPEITAAPAIPREERLAETQRAPAKSAAKAKAEAEAKVRASEPGYQRRSVERPLPVGSGSPAPAAVIIYPAAIVEGSESPRSIVDPSPSIGRLPNPMSGTVGRPAWCNPVGNPDISILRNVAPASVLIEVAGPNYAGSNVARGDGVVFPLIADLAPIIEAVGSGCGINLMRQRISVGEPGLLTFVHTNRLALAGGFALAFPHRDQGCVSVRIDVEAVLAGFSHGKCLIRAVDLVDFAAVKLADMHVQSALVQFDLYGIVGDVGQGQTGFGADSHHTGTEIQFRAGIFVSPDIVAVGERTVQRTLDPIASALRLNRNRSGHVSQASDATRRIGSLAPGRRRGFAGGRWRLLGRRIGRLIGRIRRLPPG
jgi:hypothetical protein